uniref:Uncharacterized protein n=1 Tax=Octopus bimaculoides TaxID=37653 RepID=A0A0L8I5Z1_OCTBM
MVRGRTAASQFLVPEQEILSRESILEESWTIIQLGKAGENILQWLARRRLIMNMYTCENCNSPCGLTTRGDVTDEKLWNCKHCKRSKSVRYRSFFERSHISLLNIILIIYCWSRDMSQNNIMHESSVSSRTTVIDWCNFCREVWDVWLEQNSTDKKNTFVHFLAAIALN